MAKVKVNIKKKSPQKQNKTALVVYRAPQKTVQKQKKKKTLQNAGMPGDLAAYKASLVDPFSTRASNARVPDMYSCPTTTRKITKSFVLSTNANGEADLIVLPNAFVHAISTRASTTAGSIALGDGTNANCVMTSPTVLGGVLSNYRIVGYGVKVIGLQAENTASGKFQAATLPISTWVNSRDQVGGITATKVDPNQTMPAWLQAMGLQWNGNQLSIESIPSLTNSVIGSVNKLNDYPMQIVPKITSPEAFNFRQSTDSPIGFAVSDQTTASFLLAGDASYMRIAGHEAVVFTLSGCTPSTSIVEVEIVYHLEGTPAATGTSAILQSTEKAVVNPTGWMKVVQEVSSFSPFRLMVENAGNAIVPGLGTLANRLF